MSDAETNAAATPAAPQKRRRGRPSRFTPQLAQRILARIAGGESLRAICSGDGMPSEGAVRGWIRDDVGGIATHYARAREDAALAWADELISLADASPGQGEDVSSFVQRQRLRIDARRWVVSRMLPKVFGDRLDVAHGGGLRLTVVTGIPRGGDPDEPQLPDDERRLLEAYRRRKAATQQQSPLASIPEQVQRAAAQAMARVDTGVPHGDHDD